MELSAADMTKYKNKKFVMFSKYPGGTPMLINVDFISLVAPEEEHNITSIYFEGEMHTKVFGSFDEIADLLMGYEK